MLGLRLDQPLPLSAVDGDARRGRRSTRMEALGLAERSGVGEAATLALTARGRFVGDAVTAELIA